MDDGRLTDGQGRTVNFRNTVLIMTSNIGSEYILEAREEDEDINEELVLKTMRNYFKPEFLNRVDDIIIYNFLTKDQIKDIVDIQIERLNETLEDHGVQVELTEPAKELLAEKGFDPEYGARPLKRAIQKYIQNPLSMKILEGKFLEGDIIKVDANHQQKLEFEKIGEITT
jgi:ATP-dependent Clp protease ATP-binding subunit ClpB